jgi:hypothetical protein
VRGNRVHGRRGPDRPCAVGMTGADAPGRAQFVAGFCGALELAGVDRCNE